MNIIINNPEGITLNYGGNSDQSNTCNIIEGLKLLHHKLLVGYKITEDFECPEESRSFAERIVNVKEDLYCITKDEKYFVDSHIKEKYLGNSHNYFYQVENSQSFEDRLAYNELLLL